MDDEVRKRKACETCTRAKAKCEPLKTGTGVCHRCDRLKKECVFENSTKRKTPKSRSRVKRLEKRVESLIDLLSTNGQTINAFPTPSSPTSDERREDANLSSGFLDAPFCMTTDEVAERRYQNLSAPKITPLTYDPVELGLIDRPRANSLLKLFKTCFTPSFPFVVVPAATDLDTFRRQKPFLFHAIMTIMTFKTPALQKRLASDLLEQISSRIILRSHKSLEIVQGLLVFSGWYHFFYRPECQQMANTIQLCVAMISCREACTSWYILCEHNLFTSLAKAHHNELHQIHGKVQ